ncbi:MAG: branched-chain amino acid ABC transporter permease [Clostridiaceae bacterium]|nr:branched-chain amino acid ABC transporter permease [Clostridiaceae bacterium]
MIYVGVLAGLLIIPLLSLNNFTMRMVIMAGTYMILAMSLNLITGYTGQLSLGHAAFYAIGAYTSAILSMRFGWSFLITAPAAALMAALVALLLGIPTLKLQGAYLAIVTLGFSEIVRIVALNWMGLTRGPMGIPGIARPEVLGYRIASNTQYYYLILALVIITYMSLYRIINSRLGRAFIAIREDDLAAQSMGVDILKYKILSFTIAAFFAGLAGSFYAHYVTYIDPQSFTFNESIQVLSMVVLGGMGSMPGAIIGSVILTWAPEMLRFLEDYRMIMYGAILIVMMPIRPQGILGGIRFKLDKEEENQHEAVGSE